MGESVQEWHVPMVSLGEFLLALLEQGFQTGYPLISRDELALCDRDLLLQTAILLHELPLDVGKLLEVSLEESHLLLLGPVV